MTPASNAPVRRPAAVLLGPDYAGKSSAMAALAAELPGWRLLSVDEPFLAPEHALLATLRRHLVEDVLPGAYSPEFAAALLQTAVVHLRDQVAAPDPRPALVDSYYYKILAKLRLAGAEAEPMFTWWRGFPQPERVVFLDVSPATAWRRSAAGAALNPFEHDGPVPGREPFEAYQARLREALLAEVAHLPVTVVHEQPDTAHTVKAIRKALVA